MLIGVVADTHVGEHLPALPPEVLERLDGVDLILHVGDVSVPWVLDELREVAPVTAVQGNHDGGPLRRLPRDAVVEAGTSRIGLTHGTRPAAVEIPSGLLSVAAGRPVLLGFGRTVVRRFPGVDLVVAGHLHMHIDERVEGVRLFSPGAVFVPEIGPEAWARTPTAWAYRRYRRSLPDAERRPAIGLIEAGPDGLEPRRVELERPVRTMRRRRPR